MRMPFRSTTVVFIGVVALLLTGCAPTPPVITPEPSPSSSPVFASDEDALAAATEAYRKYLEMSDRIAQDGGSNPDRIAEFVAPHWLPNEMKQFAEFARSAHHQVGVTKFDGVRLQRIEDDHGSASVIIYACLDFSAAKVVDESNLDITPSPLDVRSPFEVSFDSSSTNPAELLLSGMVRWEGSNVC